MAVVINEFGAVGLDHLLVEAADQEVLQLPNGCLCCAVRQDLADTLYGLLRRRARGEISQFSRIALETSGLAEPSPFCTHCPPTRSWRRSSWPGSRSPMLGTSKPGALGSPRTRNGSQEPPR